jgi:hypothetical protein
MKFANWDWRPAVIFPSAAFAVLAPGEDWSRADFADVVNSAGLMDESTWRATFEGGFGRLDLSTIPVKSDSAAIAK